VITMYLNCNVKMYIITMLNYTDMLSVYTYGYSTLCIYVTMVLLYPVGQGITWWLSGLAGEGGC